MSITIEFSGTPDAGKTTLITSLYNVLTHNGYNTVFLKEGNGETPPPHNARSSLHFNEWVGTNACTGILTTLQQKPEPDIVLIDRGFIDFRFWNYFYEKTGKASPQEVQDLQKKPLFTNLQLAPDLFVAVTVSIEEALNRNPSLSCKLDWVKQHNDLFEKFYNTYKGNKAQIETTDLSKEQVLLSVIEIITNAFPNLKINYNSIGIKKGEMEIEI